MARFKSACSSPHRQDTLAIHGYEDFYLTIVFLTSLSSIKAHNIQNLPPQAGLRQTQRLQDLGKN